MELRVRIEHSLRNWKRFVESFECGVLDVGTNNWIALLLLVSFFGGRLKSLPPGFSNPSFTKDCNSLSLISPFTQKGKFCIF